MSATTDTLEQTLRTHEAVWNERPVLRRLYRDWYRLIKGHLAEVPGTHVELGSGIGRFREVVPDVVTTDIEPTPWADAVVDGETLPYADGSLANLVLIDVFHHLSRPAAFLSEASRALHPGGRVVILDPYCSPVSTLAYSRFHEERVDLRAPSLADDPEIASSPYSSNQARATLVFFRDRGSFERRWPELRIVERRRLSFFLYPLSGGFSRPALVPAALYAPFSVLERMLAPLGSLAAFRCFVVLERA